jgi:hypothetical protein
MLTLRAISLNWQRISPSSSTLMESLFSSFGWHPDSDVTVCAVDIMFNEGWVASISKRYAKVYVNNMATVSGIIGGGKSDSLCHR